MPNNVSFGVQAKGVAKASSDIDNLKDKFANLQKQGAKGIGIGIAAGATSFALGAASQAVSQFTDVIGDSVKAAMEDEESQNRMRASLLTNVPAWNGNTDAIERNISAKEKLGFEDNELRDSLTVLVGATHDVAKAQDIQNTAMDLARFKGISLHDASEALIKVEAGQYRSLKSLGIVLKEGATQTDALAAVQKVAAGQAEAYANTTSGKMQIAQVAINEAMESFGYTILPVVSEALVQAAKDATGLAATMDVLQHGFSNDSDAASDQAKSILDVVGAVGELIPGLSQLSDAAKAQATAQDKVRQSYNDNADAVHDMRVKEQADTAIVGDSFETMRGGIGDDLAKAEHYADHWRDVFHKDSGQVIRDSIKVRDQLSSDAQDIIDSYFDPIEKRAELHNTRLQLFADEDAKRKAKTKTDSRDAADAIVQDLDDEASKLVDLGKQHDLTATDVDKFAKDAKANYASLGSDAQQHIDDILAKLRTLQKFPDITEVFTLEEKGNVSPAGLDRIAKDLGYIGNQDLYKKKPIFDKGGVVPGPVGSPQDIIAHGGETVRNPAQEAALHAGGDTYIYNVYPQGRWDVDANSVGAAVARLKAISKKRAA